MVLTLYFPFFFFDIQPTDLMSQASIYQTGTVTASTFGGGPFTRCVILLVMAYETLSDKKAQVKLLYIFLRP